MASTVFSHDDVNALADTVESLKISALKNAAKISPLVKGPTIGPRRTESTSPSKSVLAPISNGANSNDTNNQSSTQPISLFINNNNNNTVNNRNNEVVNLKPYDPKTSKFRSDVWRDVKPDSEECDTSRSMLQLSDCKVISFRLKAHSVEKERRAKFTTDLQTKQAEWNTELEQRLQRIRIDAAEKQRQTQAKRLEREMAVLRIIEEIGVQSRQEELATKQRDNDMIEHSRRLMERAALVTRQDELRLLLEIVNACKTLFINQYECFAATIINNEDVLSSIDSSGEYKKLRDTYLQRYESMMKVINTKVFSTAEVQEFEKLCDDLKAEQAALEKTVNETREKIARAMAEKAAANALRAPTPPVISTAVTVAAVPNELSVTDGPKSSVAGVVVTVSHAGNQERIAFYNELMQFYEQYRLQIQPLLLDANLKKFRFNCQKAVNIPVNSIAATSPEHLQDKFEKITLLLAGKQIYSGDVRFSAAEHPLGIHYCTWLVAKKFITQGSTVLATSSHPENVFSIASVFVAVWQHFPDLGRLFLALLYKECPFFVPYFIQQEPNQNINDYLKLLGYQFNDGVMEKSEQYLSRISGLQRLYSAIMTAKLRARQAQAPHPHGLEHAWIWLSNILMLDPLAEVFPTLILRFIEICGPDMLTVYGKQFVKMIIAVQVQCIPKLDQIDSGGPFTRLKVLIETIITDGRIEQLKGILPANFW